MLHAHPFEKGMVGIYELVTIIEEVEQQSGTQKEWRRPRLHGNKWDLAVTTQLEVLDKMIAKLDGVECSDERRRKPKRQSHDVKVKKGKIPRTARSA